MRVQNPRDKERVQRMASLYRSGKTLQAIGNEFGVSRERVRQLISATGMTGKSGGQHLQGEIKKAQRSARLDEHYLKKHGCTYSQYRSLVLMGRSTTRDRSPTGAFARQKQNAKSRGINWNLKVWEWWTIWRDSGHWEQRGRGQGYCMARNRDEGPYEVGNVSIITAIENCSDAPKKKKHNLPCGVRAVHGRFVAQRMLRGQKRYLGTYATPQEAHEAWRAAA